MSAVAQPTPTGDGRTARRDRNRDAVLDAVIDLFTEDCTEPSASDVAARSGVSLRSVYRYYQDMDELARAAIERHVERVGPLLDVDDVTGTPEERIRGMAERRTRLYERIAPTARAAVARSRTSHVLREQVAYARRRSRAQVESVFSAELSGLDPAERDAVAAALDVLLGFESVEHLRRHRGLSGPETSTVLATSVRRLLGDPRAGRE